MRIAQAIQAIPDEPELQAASFLQSLGRWALRGAIASLVFHVLLVAAAIYIHFPPEQYAKNYLQITVVPRPQILMTDALSLVDETVDQFGLTLGVETPEVILTTEKASTPRPAEPDEAIELTATAPAAAPAELPREPDADAELGTIGQPAVVTWGSANALDRLSIEISQILWRRKALIIWCFDRSAAIQDDRQQIGGNLAKMYGDLGLIGAIEEGDVVSAVTSFADDVKRHTPKPTSNVQEVVQAIEAIPSETAESYSMCKAIARSIYYYQRFSRFSLEDLRATGGKEGPQGEHSWDDSDVAFDRDALLQGERKMVLVLVTDTAGDLTENQRHLEDTLQIAKKAGCRIYVLGREAMFNSPYAPADPGSQSAGHAGRLVNRGSDTAFQEVLHRNLWGRRSDVYPSGFGPYAQARLVRETGGLFFMVPSPADSDSDLELRALRQRQTRLYVPQLDSREVIESQAAASELRKTILQVVDFLDPVDPEMAVERALLASLPGERNQFLPEATRTITRAENIFRYYRRTLRKLDDLEPLRDQEPSRRWRANYDLLRADVATLMARTYEYGVALIARKNAAPSDREPVRIELRNRTRIHGYQRGRVYEQRARHLLQRVIDEHPGTPWAARAQAELDRGFGIVAVDIYTAPASPPPVSPPSARAARRGPLHY